MRNDLDPVRISIALALGIVALVVASQFLIVLRPDILSPSLIEPVSTISG